MLHEVSTRAQADLYEGALVKPGVLGQFAHASGNQSVVDISNPLTAALFFGSVLVPQRVTANAL